MSSDLDEDALEEIYSWIDKIPLSRPKKNIARDFSDGGSYIWMCFAIWYHLCKFKNVRSSHGEALLLVKLQASSYNFTESNTPPLGFFTFFKLYIMYQIMQNITYSYLNFHV